jgi:hypothetical protein
MFFPGSRYETTGTYTVTLPNGQTIRATKLPQPRQTRICDANETIVPEALAARDLIGIPSKP